MVTKEKTPIEWLEPSPMWGDQSHWVRLPRQHQSTRPMILRFCSDTFMEELLALLEQCPYRLQEWEAQPETWRNPMPTPEPIFKSRPNPAHEKLYNGSKLILNRPLPDLAHALNPKIDMRQGTRSTSDPLPPVKLYQAAHQRFYLVAASLISEEKSYPDYTLNLSDGERATFVIRAVAKNEGQSGTDEYAYVVTPGGHAWKKVSAQEETFTTIRQVLPNEERLALFPLFYPDRCGRQRQIMAGFIPVGKREEWLGAPEAGGAPPSEMIHPVPSNEGGDRHLNEMFCADVVEPWRALVEQAQYLKASLNIDSNSFPNFSDRWQQATVDQDTARALKSARDQLQTGSWYVLLDLANFLASYLPDVWDRLNGRDPARPLGAAEQECIDRLQTTTLSADLAAALAVENFAVARNTMVENTLWEELVALWDLEERLEVPQWPDDLDALPAILSDRLNDAAFTDHDREQFQNIAAILHSGTWLTLLDLSAYLNAHVPHLKARALGHLAESHLTQDEKRARARFQGLTQTVLNALRGAIGVADLSDRRIRIHHSLAAALVAVKADDVQLNRLSTPFDRNTPPPEAPVSPVIDGGWPDFLFPLADPDPAMEVTSAVVAPSIPIAAAGLTAMDIVLARIEALADLVDTLLPGPVISAERRTGNGSTPFLDPNEARFVVRCVFERPHCGPMFPARVSAASRPMELAPFFDPDAPARPVRIALPMDVSPAGLRKYKKNAVFLISDMLCGKIRKIKKLSLADLVLSVLPWPFHKDLPKVGPAGPCQSDGASLGMFCSLSIPIVTLCALILMIIMVKLFDFIFRWMPFLFVCLPVPGFKGKKDDGS